MFKKIILISILLILNNCTAPGTAFLGPAFTGAKTGSIYQTSLSYTTGRVMNNLNPYGYLSKDDELIDSTINTSFTNSSDIKNYNDLPEILISYKVDKIDFSEVIEPEPLP